ncbi:MAG: hypothetical protein LBB25_01990 [Holosporaceae bacterium]|jgi:hypothetical protein|nr:hypothetical protein [Holosporaceae bacterium]
MAKMFNDNVRGMLTGVCCAAVMVCGNVSGMMSDVVEIAGSILISDREQFCAITPEEARDIKSIKFDGIEINSSFVSSFYSAMYHCIDSLSFNNCTLIENCFFSDLFDSEYPVVDFAIVNCAISIKDASLVLSLINPHLVRIIDFSKNGFGGHEILFENEILKKRIYGRMCLDAFILKESGFSSNFVDRITQHNIIF